MVTGRPIEGEETMSDNNDVQLIRERCERLETAPPLVKIRPELHEQGSGVTATINYDNPDFVRGLRQMFHAKPRERLVQIEIQDEWITARFELDSSA